MAVGNVIQGYFPNGPRFGNAGAPLQLKAATRPGWVQQAIAQGAARNSNVQAKTAAPAGGRIVPLPPRPQHAVLVPTHFSPIAAGGGQPLPHGVRQKMEALFGTGFADVRVHVGPQAPSIGALAFTHGSNIHFAPGQYDPNSPRGQQILGHELAHVVQQRTGRVRNPFGTGLAVVQDPALEAEAEQTSRRIGSSRPAPARVAQRSSILVVIGTPTLGVDVKTNDYGACGCFCYERKWKVTNANKAGIIVQRVDRVFHVSEVNSNNEMSGKEIDDYVTTKNNVPHATVTTYWECWEVDSSGKVSDTGIDTFQLGAIIKAKNHGTQFDTTKGSYQIKGEASFYETNQSPDKFGFKRDSVSVAGELWGSLTLPINLPSATSGPVKCTVDVRWDSSDKKTKDSTVKVS